MAASVQFRPQNRDLGVVMREVDEDLAIFLGMQKVENDPHEFDDSKGAKSEPPLEPEVVQITADDNLLNLEIDKNEYNWLINQPDTSLLPSVEADVQDSIPSNTEISNVEAIFAVSPKSKLVNPSEESASLSKTSSSKLATSTNGRPLSSSENRKPTPRSRTPTARSSIPAKSKGSRSSTPTSSRATPLPSSKPTTNNPRSSTPTSRTTSRSSTPSSIRPSIPVITSKSAPTRKSATPTPPPGASSTVRSSSAIKKGPTAKNPSKILSLSHDAPQNSRISVPKRPSSASRGRPSSTATHLPSSNGKPRQKSCSPTKTRVPNVSAAHKIGSKMLSRNRGYGNGGDDVNPVLMGTQMVERVVNMRKLAPPKQDEYVSHDNLKKSSLEKGFGRSLSKKSLDMAIRHMDIRRSINENLRPVATGFQSGTAKCSTVDVSESPLTSSSGSSKSSCINSYFLNGNETE